MNETDLEKGRKAERIVEDLFREAGFNVIKYGYENTVPELTPRNNGSIIKGKAGDYIRHQPDFIVVNNHNEAFFVEVKFRSKYILPDREIFPYPNCFVVLLDKKYIQAQSTYYLFNKNRNFERLNEMPPFKSISSVLIGKYVQRLRRELGDETLGKQIKGKLIKKLFGEDIVKPKTAPVKVIRKKRRRFSKIRYRK